jgi:hypothetical protein
VIEGFPHVYIQAVSKSYAKIKAQNTTVRTVEKEKVQMDKQRSTKHTHKTKDRVTRTSLKLGVNPGAP